MNQAIREEYEIKINVKRFFETYFPDIIPGEPYEFFDTEEDEEDKTPSLGWDNLPEVFLMLGQVTYRTIGQVHIEKDKDGTWGMPTLSLVNTKTRQLNTINLWEITPGWVNKYSEVDKYYEDALMSLPVKP
jgi:hypothetical protein